jgi:hypothetical protein
VNAIYTITDGLATISMDQLVAESLFYIMRSKIRSVMLYPNYKDVVAGNEPMKNALKAVHIMSRMCYEIVSNNTNNIVYLSDLSSEDIELLYNLDKDNKLLYDPSNFEHIPLTNKGLQSLQNLLTEIRLVVRPSGPVDILEADKMAKDFVTVMES